jgi:hypothetical protein
MSLLSISYGGGVNSAAMIELMIQKSIRPDLILFADTGGEKDQTYLNIAEHSKRLIAIGYPGIVTVHATRKGEKYTLAQHSLKTRLLPSLAYGKKSCSQKFKAAPMEKFINNWPAAQKAWKAGDKVVKAIGYHSGESHRVAKVAGRNAADKKYIYWYPLIEWGITQDACKKVVKDSGVIASKSSCTFCPAMRRGEILQLKHEHPEKFQEALLIERTAQQRHRIPTGLGGGNVFWSNIDKEDNEQIKLWDWIDDHSPHAIPCECHDG